MVVQGTIIWGGNPPKPPQVCSMQASTVIIFFRLELDGICSDDFKEELLTPTNEDKTEDGSDWGDIMNVEDKHFHDYREPGRLATVHEKLMSPSRKKKPELSPESYR